MNTQEEMTVFMLAEMLKAAKEHNVKPTENAEKIARTRVRLGMPITVCPCDSKATDRGCIGPKCLKELQETNTCCCRAFTRGEE